jgi:hypothetical protein
MSGLFYLAALASIAAVIRWYIRNDPELKKPEKRPFSAHRPPDQDQP